MPDVNNSAEIMSAIAASSFIIILVNASGSKLMTHIDACELTT